MQEIDLTGKLAKNSYSRVLYCTLYTNRNYIGFASSIGIGFVRSLKKGGIKCHANGTAKWYFSNDNTLTSAVAKVRDRYSLKVPVKGWEKMRVKVWSNSDAEQIINSLKN